MKYLRNHFAVNFQFGAKSGFPVFSNSLTKCRKVLQVVFKVY